MNLLQMPGAQDAPASDAQESDNFITHAKTNSKLVLCSKEWNLRLNAYQDDAKAKTAQKLKWRRG